MEAKYLKNARTLDMYERLCEGKTLHKSEEASRFHVDERSIQRDIDDIRAFLAEREVTTGTDHRRIVYDRKKNGYVLQGARETLMTNSEILAVSKILLESRAFSKPEIEAILDKMVQGCVPQNNMKLVSDLLANEKHHYVELHHHSFIADKLWDIGLSIRQQNLLEIRYQRAYTPDQTVKRIVEPAAILFSEYYFYLNAFIVEKDAQGNYVHQFDYPAVFRIDRIQEYKDTGEKFTVNRAERFEAGEFRKRTQFMYPGKLLHILLRYTGPNPEAVLDRLPTAEVRGEDGEDYLIAAEVYGKGIMMWLLSQGDRVEVLEPASLRQEMQEMLQRMMEKYR